MTDEKMDNMIGLLLRAGVATAAATTLAGGIWHFARNGGAMPDYHTFHGKPSEIRNLGSVFKGIVQGRPLDLIQLGLLLLIATPVARVALSLAAFAIARDRIYVLVTLIVLVILITSLAGFYM